MDGKPGFVYIGEDYIDRNRSGEMMDRLLLVATNQGLLSYIRADGDWKFHEKKLTGRRITCVISRDGIILAGTREGIFRSLDKGLKFQPVNSGLGFLHIRWLSFLDKTSRIILAGTEPAAIYISDDHGQNWRNCPEVEDLRDKQKWYLPYSPEAGCVRGFASHGDHVFAAVEVGGVLRSEDAGKTWKMSSGQEIQNLKGSHNKGGAIHDDVHSIEVHPKLSNMVYAPTGGGFYRSMDSGVGWTSCYRCYCRAVWIDPDDPDYMILGPADGVDRNGRIELSTDGGKRWVSASQGLEVPWERYMVERFQQIGSEIMAVLSNGSLIRASIDTLLWQPFISNIERVNGVSILED